MSTQSRPPSPIPQSHSHYGIGARIGPLGTAFAWSRTQIMFCLTLATMVYAVCSDRTGLADDKYDQRRFAVLLITGAFAPPGIASMINFTSTPGACSIASASSICAVFIL